MHPDSTNLLPEDSRQSLRREYFVRLGVVALLLISGVIAISAVMLYPTHSYLANELLDRQQELDDLASNAASADEHAFEARLTALSSQAARINLLSSTNSTSVMLSEILEVAHEGVTLNGFNVTPSGKSVGTVVVVGRAVTRDDLRAYQLALQSSSFVASASLPVSAYAQDKNIDFTITVTFTTP